MGGECDVCEAQIYGELIGECRLHVGIRER